MTTTADEPDMAAIAEKVLSDASRELALSNADLPQAVRDAHSDYQAAIGEVLDAGRQATRDLAELRAKSDLIPPQGLARLRHEALTEAEQRSRKADRRAERALERLRGDLTDAALPRLDPNREKLARDELTVAVGNARGARAEARIAHIVKRGSPDAAAVLLRSSFGRTLLESRGLSGRDLEDALATARTIGAAVAHERGRTPRELLAGASLARLGKLGAARGAASLAVRHALKER